MIKVWQKVILNSVLTFGVATQVFANDCLADNEKVPGEPGDPKITSNGLHIYSWKFSCTQSRNVAIGVAVYNGNSSVSVFDWNDVTVGGANVSKDREMIPAKSATDVRYVWSTKSDVIEKKSTLLAYKRSLTAIVSPFAYGSDNPNTGSGKKLSATSGLWYDSALDGTGFNFVDMEYGLAVTYYGYDKNGGKNWMSSVSFGPKVGEIVAGKSYTIKLNQPKPGNGGKFDQKPSGEANGTMTWGTMTIIFNDCKTATATMSGVDGNKVFNLTKLVGNVGADCKLQ